MNTPKGKLKTSKSVDKWFPVKTYITHITRGTPKDNRNKNLTLCQRRINNRRIHIKHEYIHHIQQYRQQQHGTTKTSNIGGKRHGNGWRPRCGSLKGENAAASLPCHPLRIYHLATFSPSFSVPLLSPSYKMAESVGESSRGSEELRWGGEDP